MLDSDDPAAMAAFVAAAERYFQQLPEPQRLFSKPFVPLDHAGYNVLRVGYLLEHLDHRSHHAVLDFGAGMCWLTAVLMQTGCRVIALDVSATALALGAEALRDARVPPETPAPRLVSYDGFSIPLKDGEVDRVACFDALHHVPNKRTVLREIYRVLRRGGRACFVEPGPGHAASVVAKEETEAWGVLEDEVDPTTLCEMAAEIGFADGYVVPLPRPSDAALSGQEYKALREGARTRVLDWSGNDAVTVLLKSPRDQRDSRSPGVLAANMQIRYGPSTASPGEIVTFELAVTNRGDCIWLGLPRESQDALDYDATFLSLDKSGQNTHASVGTYRRFLHENDLAGMVSLGAQLWPVGRGSALDIDYARGFLLEDVAPGQSTQVKIRLRVPSAPGLYRLRFDAVAEGLSWFAALGHSSTCHAYVGVTGGAKPIVDSRAPGRLAAALRLVGWEDSRTVTVEAVNTGDSVWLGHPLAEGGFVRVGVQTLGRDGKLKDRDWRRCELPNDVSPGEAVSVSLDLHGLPADVTAVSVDLVSELRSWFEDRGSTPLIVTVDGPMV